MVTSVPNLAPRERTESMLRAGTAFLSAVRMVTGTDCAPAAATNSAAGRACSPLVDPTMTVREGIAVLLSGQFGLDRHLDRLTPGDDVQGLEGALQRQPVRDE